MYSIDKFESFEQLGSWMKEIVENAHQETIIWIVGCKLDLDEIRKVSKNTGSQYSKSIDAAGFIEVSSKTGQNVKQVTNNSYVVILESIQGSV